MKNTIQYQLERWRRKYSYSSLADLNTGLHFYFMTVYCIKTLILLLGYTTIKLILGKLVIAMYSTFDEGHK